MDSRLRIGTVGLALIGVGAGLAGAQVLGRRKTVDGFVLTAQIKALTPPGQAAPGAAPEVRALAAGLARVAQITVKAQLAKASSRIEIVSPGFALPPGTLVMHEAGQRSYVLANPKDRTFVVMDAEALVNAVEGTMGVVDNEYQARVQHLRETKLIAGHLCSRSKLIVTYASSIPFESDRILVQQKNEVEIWHTPSGVAVAALDHLFFKFRGDRTGQVQKVVGQELGFPLEITFVGTPAAAGAKATAQPGSFHMVVTDIQADRLEPALFTIPPEGFRRLERNPYFARVVEAGK